MRGLGVACLQGSCGCSVGWGCVLNRVQIGVDKATACSGGSFFWGGYIISDPSLLKCIGQNYL